jgi:hypothetical protein
MWLRRDARPCPCGRAWQALFMKTESALALKVDAESPAEGLAQGSLGKMKSRCGDNPPNEPATSIPLVSRRPRGWRPDHPTACSGARCTLSFCLPAIEYIRTRPATAGLPIQRHLECRRVPARGHWTQQRASVSLTVVGGDSVGDGVDSSTLSHHTRNNRRRWSPPQPPSHDGQ